MDGVIVKVDISNLTPGVFVDVICPVCGAERKKTVRDITRKNATTCCHSCYGKFRNLDIIGKTFEKISVLSFAQSGKYVNVRCECGKEWVASVHDVKTGKIKSCGSCFNVGERHHNYKPHLTQEQRLDRRLLEGYQGFLRSVLMRDNFTCSKCGKVGGNLDVHHIESYSENIDLACEMSNAVTLCKKCHKNYHVKFLGGYYVKATKETFNEWRII